VHTIGVDVGGTKVAAGLVDEAGTILRRTRGPTPSASPDDVEDVIAACVAELPEGVEVEAVGIGAAGFVTADRATVLLAPNLSWRDEPLRDGRAERVGPAGRGGERRERRGLGRVPLRRRAAARSTWCSSPSARHRRRHRARRRAAPRAARDRRARSATCRWSRTGRRCGCGLRGCWEQYSSGRALLHEAREIAGAQRELRPAAARARAGGTLEGIESVEVTQAAREGDPRRSSASTWSAAGSGQGHGRPRRRARPGVFLLGGACPTPGDLLLPAARGVPRAADRVRQPARGGRAAGRARATTPASSGAADLARTR
jgi:glucokinase